MKERKVLVDTLGIWTRRLVLEDGVPVEYALAQGGQAGLRGCIYLGRVVNVLPGMGAAFVDIGLEKNAFLPLDDLPPAVANAEGIPPGIRPKPLRPGREVIVQVVKEPAGDKGPRLTMNITFPGKYVVLLPTLEAAGVSRHIADPGKRAALLEAAKAACPGGAGLIVRTAAEDAPDDAIAKETRELMASWEAIAVAARTAKAPALLAGDGSLISQSRRDLNAGIIAGPFEEGLENKLKKALARKVWLDCGGFLVFDRTEAMTVIDVNSGKYTGKSTLDETVRRLNMEAAREIARLIRLRDIGGIIVVDFVDMDTEEDREAVLEVFRDALAGDRAKGHVYGFTGAGLLEMTRRPVVQPILDAFLSPCGRCGGTGAVPSADMRAIDLLREIRRRRAAGDESEITLEAEEDVALALEAAGWPEGVVLEPGGDEV